MVDKIRPQGLCTALSSTLFTRESITPLFSSTAPMVADRMMIATVLYMEVIPPRERILSTMATPVSEENPFMAAPSIALRLIFCSRQANTPLMAVQPSMAGTAGTFNAEVKSTSTAGTRAMTLILKFAPRVSRISSMLLRSALAEAFLMPSTVYRIRQITVAGTVVYIMEPMWSYRGVPDISAATLVVSDRGDILSPKKAPEQTAPAISGAEMPILVPTPNKAKPMVAIEPKEVPVKRLVIAQRTKASGTMILGEQILRP